MLLGMHAQNDTDSHFTLSLCLAPLLCSTKWIYTAGCSHVFTKWKQGL